MLNHLQTAGFLDAIRDLTERQRLQGRIIQAEKLASLSLLSAGVAHEINNPLAYVTNNLAVLERDVRGLAEVLAAYEEARPTLEMTSPEVARRIARLTVENDLPYVQENLGAILKSTQQGVKRVSDIVQNLRGFARLEPGCHRPSGPACGDRQQPGADPGPVGMAPDQGNPEFR